MMMVFASRSFEPSILIASDSEHLGRNVRQALESAGFEVHFAGEYAGVEGAMKSRKFDLILLEVTGQHAVESAVEAALRVKREDGEQIVGYLADSSLHTSGLGGDGVFPRNADALPGALRSFFSRDFSREN